ncbi:MAG: tRNA uridine(34) 5-carboxymethylaminomethyl modification radical SAM/GNAT enzyme Elp3 [Patescibacteria group bacterium]|jgi:elongator complex protein 3
MNKKTLQKYVIDFVRAKPETVAAVRLQKRRLATKYSTTIIPNSEILGQYRLQGIKKPDQKLLRLLRKREIRTLSGVAPVTVLTKPYPCPGRCVYCPTEARMPKSYLSSEPAAQRGLSLKFDPYKQVKMRIDTLEANGHSADKIELIVLGGTWSHYPHDYQAWFIKRCFDAANGRTSRTLQLAQTVNEKVEHRIIGLSLETRPDHVTPAELWRMRELGCTHVQIGVQTLHQDILDLVKRDDTLNNIARATELLRAFGFKFTYHLMPGLPGATPKKDFDTFKMAFTDSRFQPDMLKIYPCLVIKNSILYHWYKAGKFKPYNNKQLADLLVKIKGIVPPYVRINRLIRDIPGPDIIAGNRITNLRQLLQERGVECKCIRCREARKEVVKQNQVKLKERLYKAGAGEEHFISFESKDEKKIYGFVRLWLPDQSKHFDGAFDDKTALIRELHTYGELMPIGGKKKAVQHIGFGKRLLAEAERIAKKNGYKKMAIISGVGVREYYKKLGYQLERTYLVKII